MILPFETNGSANHHELVFSKSSARPQALAGPIPGSLVPGGSVLSWPGVWTAAALGWGPRLQRLWAPCPCPTASARQGQAPRLASSVGPGSPGLSVFPEEASSGTELPTSCVPRTGREHSRSHRPSKQPGPQGGLGLPVTLGRPQPCHTCFPSHHQGPKNQPPPTPHPYIPARALPSSSPGTSREKFAEPVWPQSALSCHRG